jgi:hypothetical protein
MDIEILEILGFAFAVIGFATMAYGRRMDVLYGPYIRGRVGGFPVKRIWHPASSAIDRLFTLESERMIYLGSTATY